MIPTYALVVGVSKYQSDIFGPLPGAQADALCVVKSLISWGIPERNITCLCSSFEKKETFELCLKKLAAKPGPFQLLFYFCGHGFRTSGPHPKSFLIFSDTEVEKESCSGIHLEELIDEFSRLNASSIYIFIDACHLRLNALINPKLIEELQGKKNSKKSLFCLLSSGILPSFESVDKYGYFTEALINALGEIRHTDRSPVLLFQLIQTKLKENELPEPEMYNIGTHTIDFLPTSAREEVITQDSEEIKKAIAAIYSCGLFINEELFRKSFNIDIKTLTTLEKTGLIAKQAGCWRPHDYLIELAESKQIEIDQESTLHYWSKQLEELPGHFESALNLVLALKCFGYQIKLDHPLKSAFQVLYDHKAHNVLKDCITIFDQEKGPSSIFLAEILLELQEFDSVRTLLRTSTDPQARLTYCHLLWRTGFFYECIQETTSLIHTGPLIECFLHRGASHYFLGNWEEAARDFSYINHHAQNPQHIGWARCLLGTITGLRGIDVQGGKELIESGIRILTKSNDLMGAWIGWNNLGEMMWKANELRSSEYYLQKALEISEKANNTSALLETWRNLLQLELRKEAPSRAIINNLLDRIEELLGSIENFEAMQIYNTLCTAYLYLQKPLRAQHYLKKAIPLTIQSKEYHIYTLSNLSLLWNAYSIDDKSTDYFQRALKLAREGNNSFAAKQIESDHLMSLSSV